MAELQAKTHGPNFWNDNLAAQKIIQELNSKKEWIEGWKKIDGVWTTPEQRARPVQTAAARRNWFRKLAGWPVKE